MCSQVRFADAVESCWRTRIGSSWRSDRGSRSAAWCELIPGAGASGWGWSCRPCPRVTTRPVTSPPCTRRSPGFWLAGASVDWSSYQGQVPGPSPRRVPLPTYLPAPAVLDRPGRAATAGPRHPRVVARRTRRRPGPATEPAPRDVGGWLNQPHWEPADAAATDRHRAVPGAGRSARSWWPARGGAGRSTREPGPMRHRRTRGAVRRAGRRLVPGPPGGAGRLPPPVHGARGARLCPDRDRAPVGRRRPGRRHGPATRLPRPHQPGPRAGHGPAPGPGAPGRGHGRDAARRRVRDHRPGEVSGAGPPAWSCPRSTPTSAARASTSTPSRGLPSCRCWNVSWRDPPRRPSRSAATDACSPCRLPTPAGTDGAMGPPRAAARTCSPAASETSGSRWPGTSLGGLADPVWCSRPAWPAGPGGLGQRARGEPVRRGRFADRPAHQGRARPRGAGRRGARGRGRRRSR